MLEISRQDLFGESLLIYYNETYSIGIPSHSLLVFFVLDEKISTFNSSYVFLRKVEQARGLRLSGMFSIEDLIAVENIIIYRN